ncbi:MAG TPA: Asp-tRNA(Asn)/Glu-tRNA(Gln) amidotransferase subunit GatA [Kiritimatiellia bacterium]|jgi:aspartyl-tRNA(Asn)/glutamyl-tRNA(Gln) amidotransferase subunit A|nr:MAG: Glutamyl-tRNA(Gln) amidotransferase subunit A [Verrucomicrobia bacterium ADurb.Bin018]HOE00221.1 Asp-tRNA(Asn)/Glu-tRNA(Gln) amidotransferase subunit GatA [Kiritimatiellia bacterium]HOE37133.1 Asp-tRNA(Asn)/Glu-tRNA(Gln) amidotransferase subunit GatA [Kiritimatiellia bacterium]HOR74486.1 Asp-tRNA(Asn)/Glu-tRNA(Gln) amidotransferase subunit GatA [Kiritimatiellia bacterium]HOU58916.1 Asp-tRNA(Asn)/Glu-tRNA(Gln) amidotransferase subunit GatA [Kiritimatiellia bacterium]
MNTSLHELGLLATAAALAKKEVSAVELATALLDRAAQVEPKLNSLTWQERDVVLAAAREADTARAKGDTRPWLGVPLAVKDVLSVNGQPCTAGSKMLRNYVAPYDATVIARLRAAGCVFVARTNTDEFAMGGSTATSCFGPTRNPWSPARVPGGSSGGSAAAVAARLAPAALGTDTSGSIRQPAAFCGVTGFKPTYGRVSRQGCVANASSLDQIGPLARSVEDAAALYQAIAGVDPLDSTTSPRPVGGVLAAAQQARDLKGLKLGVPREYFIAELAPELAQLTRAAIDQCAALGAEIVEVSLPHVSASLPCYAVLGSAEASASLARYDGMRYGLRVDAPELMEMYDRTRAAGFGDEVKRRLLFGTLVLTSRYHADFYLRAQKVRTLIRQDFLQAFTACDALLGPVTLTPPPRLDAAPDSASARQWGDYCTAGVNLAGICALSVPCGFTADGLPAGLHVVGPAFQDELVLRIGAAYQHATDWHQRAPTGLE